jgi:hypothetical protein
VVVAVIARFAPDAGSVERGYVLIAVLPSIVQVKDNPLSAIEIVFDPVKPCAAEVITISPVDGVYTTLVTGFGKLPRFEVTLFIPADTNV